MVKPLVQWAGFALLLLAAKGHSQDTLSIDSIRKCYYDSYQLESKERFAEAVSALAAVQKVYGNTYTVNYRTGWLYFRNKSWAESLRFYNKALAVSPSSMEAHLGVINTLAAKLDWKAVGEHCKRALQIDYNHSAANLWQIIAYQALGNLTAAKKNVFHMLSLYPTSVAFLVELGKIQYAEADFASSKTTFTSVQILDPYNPSATQYLGLLNAPKP
jgi:tetratricopeptide (TPR) repeat protein